MYRPIDMSPRVACSALHHRRKLVRARVVALQSEPDGSFARHFPAVVAHVEAAFRHEEIILELLGDDCLHALRASHGLILSGLHRAMARVEGGDIGLGRQVIDAMAGVLATGWPVTVPGVLHADCGRHSVARAHRLRSATHLPERAAAARRAAPGQPTRVEGSR
ncbi:hypothetical protein [Massilia consociata]|uniref:Uncharacterized protein n=1 Tax=Massilia consociata TaxID=760117 RepID=A0ABV6FEJ1_9BURK